MRFPKKQVEALKAGVKEGFAEMEAFIAKVSTDPLGSGKIFGTRKFLQESAETNYGLDKPDLLRSVAAHMGLYGNSLRKRSTRRSSPMLMASPWTPLPTPTR